MKSSACILCAKRKVRCDREDPCSNCKKRQQDCLYHEDEANREIERLEALVRNLGGNPTQANSNRQVSEETSQNGIHFQHRPAQKTADANHTDAAIVQEEGELLYLETPIWRAWNGKYFGPMRNFDSEGLPADLVETYRRRGVFQTIWSSPDVSFRQKHPSSQIAEYLWSTFYERVQPILKIFFNWEVASIKERCISGRAMLLTDKEHALVFAIYCLAVESLPETGSTSLESSREELLVLYQESCEQALNAYNFWTAYDITTLRTLVLHMCLLFSQNKHAGVWDAMGIIVRKAERIGLHRDGALLGLSPFETERRRRLWWSIQFTDMAACSVNGATSITLMADWDIRLPLNIEDEDMSQQLQEMPKERVGLTSMSHCLWRYWILREHRRFVGPDGKRLGMTWTVDKRLPLEVRRSMIDKIEEDLNQKFARFCDPIKGLDMMILTVVRSVVNFLRRATLCPGPTFKDAKDFTEDDRKALLESSVQMLEYYKIAFVTPCLEIFQWHAKYLFPWSAFVHVLVEMCQETNLLEVEKLWKLVDVVYMFCPELKQMEYDRRTIYAAGLTMEAWKYLQTLYVAANRPRAEKPSYLVKLELYLDSVPTSEHKWWIKKRKREDDSSTLDQANKRDYLALTPDSSEADVLPSTVMTFEDIDWTFWSMPGGEEMISGFDMDFLGAEGT